MHRYMILVCLVTSVLSQQIEQSCTLVCGDPPTTSSGSSVRGPAGPPGPPGKQGPPGDVANCNCPLRAEAAERIARLEEELANLKSERSYKSCKEIKVARPNTTNGVYTITSKNGHKYPVYCDMETAEGGWTLVASVHENNYEIDGGKCSSGDRWSSELGWKKMGLRGDGNWDNTNTFGSVESATSDDYKNAAYFELQADNIMMWHTPNGTPLERYNISTFLKYRTTCGFLERYGGNLRTLFANHYPIVSNTYSWPADSGPSYPVVFDHATSLQLDQLLPPNARPGVDTGFVQFRAISTHQDAFAICPGVRNKPTFQYPSQTCIGSSGFTRSTNYCSDFAGLRHDANAIGTGWNAQQRLLEAAFLIFYK